MRAALVFVLLFAAACDEPVNRPRDAATDRTFDLVDLSPGLDDVRGCGKSPAGFTDLTADSAMRVIKPWNMTLGTKCLKIKIGQSVTWEGVPTVGHELGGSLDGTQPNLITNVATTLFDTEGIYGFQCLVHPSLMKGAIWVVP